MGAHAGVDVLVAELGEAELVEDGAARLRRAAAHRKQLGVLAPAQATLEAPVTLEDEVVVEIFRIHVRGAERVVVRGDRAEAGEEEIRPG